MRKLFLPALAALIALTSVAAFAQPAQRLTAGPRLSYWMPEHAQDNSPGFGVAAEYWLTEWLALEAAVDFWSFDGARLAEDIEAFPDWDIRTLSAGVLMYGRHDATFNWYISGGFDYVLLSDAYTGSDAGMFDGAAVDNTLGFHAGIGVDIVLSGRATVTVEGRYFDTRIDIGGTAPDVNSVDVSGYAILAGAKIAF